MRWHRSGEDSHTWIRSQGSGPGLLGPYPVTSISPFPGPLNLFRFKTQGLGVDFSEKPSLFGKVYFLLGLSQNCLGDPVFTNASHMTVLTACILTSL